MSAYTSLIIIVFLLCTVQCMVERTTDQDFGFISDPMVQAVLRASIENAGGLETWRSVSKFKFDKTTNLYDSLGRLEENSEQRHRYYYKPEHMIEVCWQDESGSHQLLYKDKDIIKYLNGKPERNTNNQMSLNTALSAEYTATLPFKLLNKEMYFAYQGIDTLAGNVIVHVIKAGYKPTQPSGYDTVDVWWHYFDVQNNRHCGYKVKHDDHISLVQNKQFMNCDGITVPSERSSYRLDKQRNVLYRRAEYTFSNCQAIKIN